MTCLRGADLQTAYEGTRVVCEAIQTLKGLHAVRILAAGESTAISPSQLPQRTHVVVTVESNWEEAYLKWFNRERGFSFLTRGPETPDIFVHREALRRCGLTKLLPSQIVLVRFGKGSHGLMAADIKPDKASDRSPNDTH